MSLLEMSEIAPAKCPKKTPNIYAAHLLLEQYSLRAIRYINKVGVQRSIGDRAVGKGHQSWRRKDLPLDERVGLMQVGQIQSGMRRTPLGGNRERWRPGFVKSELQRAEEGTCRERGRRGHEDWLCIGR